MNFIPKWRKGKKPPVQLDDCDYDSDRKRNRRSMMALLGGVAGFGIANKASAQQPSTLSNMPYASTPLSGAELTYVVQNGVSKKTPVSSITGSGGGTPGGTNGQVQFNNSGAFGGWGVGSGLEVVGGNLTAIGGGVSGLPSVTSIAALIALNSTTSPVAYLDLGGQSGIFAFSSANHTVDVLNDPGQGEWVGVGSGPANTFGVTGIITPVNLTGVYTLGGTFNSEPYYQNGNGFLWYFPSGPFWVIGATLGGTVNVFAIVSGGPTTPTLGKYTPNGNVTGTATVAAAPNGASGAWQRQWDKAICDWAWWGAIADCVRTIDPVSWATTAASGTDNGQAFLNWQLWAQYKTSQGIGVKVVPSAGVTGVYGWRWTTTGYYWTAGICGTGGVDLHIDGRGAIGMQQLDNEGSQTSFPSANGSGLTQANSFLINSTTIGATSFTCTTVAQAGNFTKGMTVLLMSLDEQYLGFPPNCFNYEYRLITVNGNTSTGVVSCDSIECEHLSTYPDFAYGGGFNCGAARVWVLGSHWDATQIYEGLIVGLSPTASSNFYVTFAIRKTITIDWVGVGFSETVSQSVTHIRAKRKTVGETDKLVGEINEYDCDTSVGIGCQSACPRQYNIYGGRYGAVTGWGQKFYASGATFNGAVTPVTTYGLSYGGILDNCRVVGGGIGSVLDGGGTVLTIDGTNATYANGIITLNVGPLESGEVISGWAVIPGMILMLAGTATDSASLNFTGDQGALLVLTVTWNGSTQIFINTNGPAALPSWAVGTVRKLTVGPVTLRNCTGPDGIRNASDATDNGKPYYQWYHNVIMGNTTNPYATSVEFDVSGALVSFECDVVIAHPTSGATINIVFRAYVVTPSSITPNWITVNINIGVAGKRTITTTSFTGAVGTDSVTIGSGSALVQPLPANEVIVIATGNITAPGATSPLIKVIMQSDTGISRKQIPPQNFGVQSLISAVVLPMQGQQQ